MGWLSKLLGRAKKSAPSPVEEGEDLPQWAVQWLVWLSQLQERQGEEAAHEAACQEEFRRLMQIDSGEMAKAIVNLQNRVGVLETSLTEPAQALEAAKKPTLH